MPWEIRQGTPQCSGYGVFKEGTNELEGCHETKEKAQAQMAALYSTEEMDKKYKGCGCPTCKSMDVDCHNCPVCNPGMSKADSVRVGQMVSWGSSGGNAKGKVKRVIRNGSYNVPNSDFTITGTPDNPAVVIEVYRDGKPTGRMVGHRMETLRAAKSMWSGFDPMPAMIKREIL